MIHDGVRGGRYIAAVDMGTNSFHMIIAETTPDGSFRVVDRMKRWVRLGDGVDRRGCLDEAAVTRMLESLAYFQRLAQSYGAGLQCVATSAMRDARNRKEIARRIRRELGLSVDIVGGEEEARLVFQGVRAGGYIGAAPALVIDIGGGSTEIIIGNEQGMRVAESLDMGARRYSRLFFDDQKYKPHQLRQCRQAACSKIQPLAGGFRSYPVAAVYGTSGTIRKLAEILAVFSGHEAGTRLCLADLRERRSALIEAVRRGGLPADLEPERRTTLVAGAIILEAVMEALGVTDLRVCHSALREGIVYDRLESGGQLPDHPLLAAVESMVSRFAIDREQAARVTATARAIFACHGTHLALDEEARRLLMAACRLHEIGLAISHKRIHLHGAYIIGHANLTGITQRQQQMLSAIVRFHRKATPTAAHACFRGMDKEDARITMALAAMLRLAAALNRTRDGVAAMPQFEERKKAWHWRFDDAWYARNEVSIWNAEKARRALSRLLGKPIVLRRKGDS